MIYRQIADIQRSSGRESNFPQKKLLRFAIILYGLKLNIDVIFNQGLPLLVRDIGTVTFRHSRDGPDCKVD
ncbi:putative sulfate exporter family transporter [Peribacillus frigoritolerans]|nr:putative sulfate exporter family transporter [Peribacillus frigoritolerans]